MRLSSKYLFLTTILLVIFTGMVWAQNYPAITKIESLTDCIRVYLDWANVSGKGIDRFEVYRSSGGADQFNLVGVVERGSSYFEDRKELYKTADQFFSYKIVAIGPNGPEGESNTMSVSHRSTSSAAKRTWGSIKAMFR
jgi:hypothetical protein